MSSFTITVGIAGLTGKFGRLLASHLLKNPSVSLRGYVRDTSRVPATISSSPQVQLFQGNASDHSAIRNFATGCDVVICSYLGDDTLMVDGQKALIDACDATGVPRYIASDWALDYTKLEFGQLFVKDPMKHVKAYLETKGNVKGVHILIGAFMETFFSPFYSILDVKEKIFRYWGEGDEVWEGTSYDNAAQYTAAVAVDRDAVGIQRLVGGSMTINSLAKSFEEIYGVKPKLERLGSADELYRRMHELRAQAPHEFLKYMTLFFQYYMINGQTRISPELDNEKYPQVKAVTWEDFMRAHTLEELAGAYFGLGK